VAAAAATGEASRQRQQADRAPAQRRGLPVGHVGATSSSRSRGAAAVPTAAAYQQQQAAAQQRHEARGSPLATVLAQYKEAQAAWAHEKVCVWQTLLPTPWHDTLPAACCMSAGAACLVSAPWPRTCLHCSVLPRNPWLQSKPHPANCTHPHNRRQATRTDLFPSLPPHSLAPSSFQLLHLPFCSHPWAPFAFFSALSFPFPILPPPPLPPGQAAA
jgi:hypothetical protein